MAHLYIKEASPPTTPTSHTTHQVRLVRLRVVPLLPLPETVQKLLRHVRRTLPQMLHRVGQRLDEVLLAYGLSDDVVALVAVLGVEESVKGETVVDVLKHVPVLDEQKLVPLLVD